MMFNLKVIFRKFPPTFKPGLLGLIFYNLQPEPKPIEKPYMKIITKI